MNFEITQSLENMKRKNEVYWNFKWRKYLSSNRILIILSIISLTICLQSLIFFHKDFRSSSQLNQNTTYIIIVLSILIFLFSINSYFNYKKQKKIFFEKLNLLSESKITINHDEINFISTTSQNNIKWIAFKSFSVVENCLFLSQFHDNENYEYIIDLNSIDSDVKNKLLFFVSKIITEQNIS